MEDYKVLSVAESPIIEIFPASESNGIPVEKTDKVSAMVPSTDFEDGTEE